MSSPTPPTFASLLTSTCLLLLLRPPPSLCLEPFTTGAVFGAGLASTALYAGWNTVRCQFQECCNDAWIQNNLTMFEDKFSEHVFGQHLVRSMVLRALRSHLRKSQPQKALVLSFHGWTGAGKNYVARFIAESLYKEGMRSQFVNLFISTLHFPNDKLADVYKLDLQDWIRGNVSACPQSLFVFDEIDKLPEGVIDAIKPFIDHHEEIGGLDFRRAIFLFLSNTGGRQITNKALEFWEQGRKREELEYKDFEQIVNNGAFNEEGGLHHTTVIEKSLVDLFVPFLPMERDHVRQCVLAVTRQRYLTENEVERVLNSLTYWPKDSQLYSTTGCKRVMQKVDLLLEEMYDDL